MLRKLRAKLDLGRFFRDRSPKRGPVALSSRKIYILPTREGLASVFVVFALLLGSINFQSSLGLALTFIIVGMALVSMIDAQRNLARVVVTALDAEPVFAGERARYPLHLENPDKKTRYSVAVRTGDTVQSVTDLPTGLRATTVTLPAPARGVRPLGQLTLESHYPLHLFRAWSPLNSGAEALVYPRPGPTRPWPETDGDMQGDKERYSHRRGGRDGEFAGLRDYTTGDRISAIDWKAAARTGTLPVREFYQPSTAEISLRYAAPSLAGVATERRLEQLCRWVLDADRAAVDYSLTLPGLNVPRGRGPAHRRRCLEALARYEPLPEQRHEPLPEQRHETPSKPGYKS